MGNLIGREHVRSFRRCSCRLLLDGFYRHRFASAILLRPFKVDKHKQDKHSEPQRQLSEYEQQVELKRRLRTMLENELLIPRVGRPSCWMGGRQGG
jgi:hypothetical protein